MVAVQQHRVLVGVKHVQYFKVVRSAIHDVAQHNKPRADGPFGQQSGERERRAVQVGKRKPVALGRPAVRQLPPGFAGNGTKVVMGAEHVCPR